MASDEVSYQLLIAADVLAFGYDLVTWWGHSKFWGLPPKALPLLTLLPQTANDNLRPSELQPTSGQRIASCCSTALGFQVSTALPSHLKPQQHCPSIQRRSGMTSASQVAASWPTHPSRKSPAHCSESQPHLGCGGGLPNLVMPRHVLLLHKVWTLSTNSIMCSTHSIVQIYIL